MKKVNNEEFKERVFKNNKNIIDVGEYKGASIKIKVIGKCEHEWYTTPNILYKGCNCPYCDGHKVLKGFNDIWTTHPEKANFLLNKKDGYLYSKGSIQKVKIKCPYCGRIKDIIVKDLINNKNICICYDGISYPEKFMFSLLEQLKVEFYYQKKFNWSNKKKYDFYLPMYNCIIETHGIQHYENCDLFGNLDKQKHNDDYKKELAIKNKINKYITIDCRYSNKDYMIKSILKSELNNIFDLSIIDWQECAKLALNNKIKEVCELWNEDKNYKEIKQITKLDSCTIRDYLYKGKDAGWVKYDDEEKRKHKSPFKNSEQLKIRVYNDSGFNMIFSNSTDCSNKSENILGVKLYRSTISHVLTNKIKSYKGYKIEYLNNSNNNKKAMYNEAKICNYYKTHHNLSLQQMQEVFNISDTYISFILKNNNIPLNDMKKTNSKHILVYSVETGYFLEESYTDIFMDKYNIANSSKIYDVLNGRNKSCYGYMLRYYKEEYPLKINNKNKKWKEDYWGKTKLPHSVL